jgi:hypothetical protein
MSKFISYTISYKDMLQSWLSDICPEDHVLIIYDPIRHYDYLELMGFDMKDPHLYESKVMIVHYLNIEHAIIVMNKISFTEGPLCEFWSKGQFITDNSVACSFEEDFKST